MKLNIAYKLAKHLNIFKYTLVYGDELWTQQQ